MQSHGGTKCEERSSSTGARRLEFGCSRVPPRFASEAFRCKRCVETHRPHGAVRERFQSDRLNEV
jgi:hypothetical protein